MHRFCGLSNIGDADTTPRRVVGPETDTEAATRAMARLDTAVIPSGGAIAAVALRLRRCHPMPQQSRPKDPRLALLARGDRQVLCRTWGELRGRKGAVAKARLDYSVGDDYND